MTAERFADPRDFFRWAHGLVVAGDDRFRALGTVKESLSAGLGALTGSVQASVWHLTHTPTWSEVRAGRGLAAVAARRGVDGRYVTSPASLERLPLLASHHPRLRVAPVVAPLLVVDGRTVFVGAPRGHSLEGQVFVSTVPHVAAAAVTCYERVWAGATPVHGPGEQPRFSRRMVEVAFLLTDGATDREIARTLGVSERTVSADVAEVTRRLGARGRGHAIALIGGGSY
ncbi:helix-turn-helix transcriptional regulator [Phycicoccus endophyticus]|uniref:Helix-turn-helix transcriptional regulator n=1 Tax=Phycicoccus endophyticus TaxID=1690220 RepID=A0A7G9R3V9_9MICO|nr:helix-turn-helix transcriptional regulator [Phycicoccus endophyticus]NHI18115.1 helix-turn-helix transcriptional regulator [Phycicoccus endophyticus]QNN50284.1 helix-turn-helix transcriptional regulator [Phycicoccus endophyticus]GGL26296.1 hypothetical protein GCM10012283_05640 [Phycicoccus endophyticus]